MARLLAWSDSPLAPTGFGRSAKHVLNALHDAGHEITQLAVNCDTATLHDIPWRVVVPTDRAKDPYGLQDLERVLSERRYDLFWSTFDPEVPWFYGAAGQHAIDRISQLRVLNPGFKMAGWFPVDGGPLSDRELAVLGLAPYFDAPVTMSPHVYDLIKWTLKLKGASADPDKVRERLQLIPHGVELESYRIPTKEERAAAKKAMGFEPDQFVVLQLERNQQRKQNYLALEAMEMLLARKPGLRGKVVLYQHMLPNEEKEGSMLGFDLPDLAWRYGLKPGVDVKWPPGWVAEEDMARRVYASADAFLSVSTGEGFQYPAWEALATGVPVIVPNDSARKAWFTGVSNVHLYKTTDRRLVMRGGYRRRMAYADPADAARVIRKLVEKGPTAPQRQAGRAFVEKTANVEKVKAAWVKVMADLEADLAKERRAQGIAHGEVDTTTTVVGFSSPPGLGDLLMAGPALQALRANDEKVRLHVPRHLLEAAHLCRLADEVSAEPLPKDSHGDLSDLYAPVHRLGWSDSTKPRAEVFAERLGVAIEDLKPLRPVTMPATAAKQARAQFLERFGANLGDCVAVCMESGNTTRTMPDSFLAPLVAGIKAMGGVPLLLGRTAKQCKLLGVADLTGGTDLATLAAILGEVSAVVATDSGALHLAAAQGTPLVGVFTLFTPESRLGYYDGPKAMVVPGGDWPGLSASLAEAEERWKQIKPSMAVEALRDLTGVDAPEVREW